MIVIGQDEPAARTEGPSHRPNHSERVSDVLEQVAGVYHVERTPFFISKGKIEGIAGPELDQVAFSGRMSLTSGFLKLAGVALAPRPRGASRKPARRSRTKRSAAPVPVATAEAAV